MAITISQATREALENDPKRIKPKITYKRRYWDIDTQSMVLESATQSVSLDEISRISLSRESLDRKGLNRFEAGNITLTLHNPRNQWSQKNWDGLFAKDSIARLGYRRRLMEFTIEAEIELADATTSTIIIFKGRAVDFDRVPKDDLIDITIESPMVLLRLADAEKVRDLTVVNEVATGTADGINDVFTTANNGVGRVEAIRVNGANQTIGSQVRISDLNDPDLPAKMTFTTPPPAAADVRVDYFTWLQDTKISTLVELLADEAGIGPADRTIFPVTYPNQVLNKKIFTTKPDWDAGTISQDNNPGTDDLETDSSPGDVKLRGLEIFDDFDDGNFVAPPRTWVVEGVDPNWVVTGGRLSHSSINSNAISTPSTQAQGTWEAEIQRGADTGNTYFHIIMSTGSFNTFSGYTLLIIQSVVGTAVRLQRFDAGAASTIFTSSGVNSDTAVHIYRITRDSSNQFEIFQDGTSLGTVTDATYTTSVNIGMSSIKTSGSDFYDDIKLSPGVHPGSEIFFPTGNIITATFDASDSLVSYGLLERIQNLPTGTSILYETSTADESAPGSGVPGPFDPFVAIDPGGLILSFPRRFIRVRASFTSNVGNTLTPTLSELVINYNTLTTTIDLANFTNLTVFQAITILAQIANFEWGFTRDAKLFFRPRTVSTTPVLTIELRDLSEFGRIASGRRVFNNIRASYGVHTRIANPETENDSRPSSFDEHGKIPLQVGSTQLLLDNDADIATGLAKSYLEEFKIERQLLQKDIDFRPQLELADTVLLRILDAVPNPKWHIGDSSRAIGDKDIHLYGEKQQSAYEVLARIIGIRNELGRKTSLELEEIPNGTN